MANDSLDERLAELYAKKDHIDQFHDVDVKTIIDGIRDAREHSGTTDYASLNNKPSINGVTLSGELTVEEMGLASAEQVAALGNQLNDMPNGYYYGQYDSVNSLPDSSLLQQKGYAYVQSEEPSVFYVYLFSGAGGQWKLSDNKFVTRDLETNLNSRSQTKAPTTRAVVDGLTEVDITVPKANTLTGEQKYYANANINNRAADVESGAVKALGYKVLNPAVAFASQIGEANTVYEIRDEFDLSNGSVTMPSGCTFKFNGGRVTNGTITGSVKVEANDFTIIGAECFPDGFNMSEDVLYSERIGMIANNESYATRNNHILDLVCAMTSKKIVLTNLYYIAGKRNVIGSIVIEGGCLQFANNAPTKSYFDMKEHSSLTLNGVRVIGTGNTGKRLISTENKLDYQIDEIIIKNCVFTACVVVNMDNVANKEFTTSSPFGVKRFVVKNSKFDDIRWNTILLGNCVISDEMTIEGNFVNGFIGKFIGIGQDNNYSYNTNNKKYQAEFIVRNNTFIGRPYATTDVGGDYFCPCLFEANRVIMDGNIIKNVIAVGTNYAYDSYVSSNEYYFTNNTVINVTNFRLVASNNPKSEIFKSKGRGFVREAIGNKWYIDYNEIEDIVTSYGFTIPDGFSVVKEQIIFNFTSKNDYLNFSDNTIELKGGVLGMNPSSCALVEAVINRNTFKLDSTTGSLIPYWSGDIIDGVFYQYLKKLEFCGNIINVKDKESFYVACSYSPTYSSSMVDVRIENNVSNVLLGLPSRCKRVIFRNNILTDTTDIIYPSWTKDKYYSFDENSDEYVLTTEKPSNWKTNYTDYFTKNGNIYSHVIGVTKFVFRSPVKVYKPVDSENSYIETPFVGVSSYAAFNDDKYQLNNVVFETPQLPISENSYFFVFKVALNQKVVIELPEIGLKQTMIFIKDGEDDVYVKNEVGDIVNSYKLSNISGSSASPVYIYTPEGGTSNDYQKIYYNLYKDNGGFARFVVSNPAGKLLPRIRVTYLNPTITPLKNDSISKGIESFDGKPNYWNGIKWVDADGFTDNDRIGTINNRPLSPQIGFCFIYTKTGLPIFWRGNYWITASGEFVVDNSGSLADRLALTPRKGQQFQQTVDGSTVNLIYGDYGWLKATDGTPWFDDSGTLDEMYNKYNYILLTAQPDDWPTKYNTYYKIVDGVYTLLTTSEQWALNTYYKKDVNAYKGIQVKLTDTDIALSDKVVKWNGAKFINVVDNVALKAGTPIIAFNTENDVTTATITSTGSGKIYYTTDGTEPTSSSTEYNSVVTLADGDQVKAICIRDHIDNSAVGFVKVATPVVSFDSAGILTITCDTADAKIYYTTDGSVPSTASTEYDSSASVTIAKGVTVNAIAVLIGRVNSEKGFKKRS